jgi:hypothetical protein
VRALDRIAVALKKPALRVLGIHPFHDANVRNSAVIANGADIPTGLALFPQHSVNTFMTATSAPVVR